MHQIEIDYAKHLEVKRHNLANEYETHRSNIANETETNRSNLAREAETHRNNVVVAAETNRHNVATENETSRHNLAVESETSRSNRAQEALSAQRNSILAESNAITMQNNLANQEISRNRLAIEQQDANTRYLVGQSNIRANSAKSNTEVTQQRLNKQRSMDAQADARYKNAQADYLESSKGLKLAGDVVDLVNPLSSIFKGAK